MHSISVFYYLMTNFKLFCVCVLVSVEGNTEHGQNWTGNAPSLLVWVQDNQSSGEMERKREKQKTMHAAWGLCVIKAWHFNYTPHVEHNFLSSMWLHYLTTLFYMQLNYSLCCKPNQHPVDSRVDHLHVTAAVVVLVPAKVLTQHLHKGIFLKKPSGWQYWSLMTGDRGQAGTKLLPSVVNTASDMPQLNLKPMEKPIWRPAQGKGLDLETCLNSQLDQTNYISLLPSKIMRHLGYQKYKLLSGTFW